MSVMTRPGRNYIVTVIALVLFNTLTSITVTNLMDNEDRLFSQMVRLFLTIVLCYLLYLGKNWVRILLAILSGISGLTGIAGGLLMIAATGEPLIFILLLVSILYLVCAVILLFTNEAKDYVRRVA